MNLNERCICCKEDAKTLMFHYGNFLFVLDCPVPVWGMFLLGLHPEAFKKSTLSSLHMRLVDRKIKTKTKPRKQPQTPPTIFEL